MTLHPEYLYYLLIAVIAWPCSLFSRCSGVLTAAWALGQIAVSAHMPEPKTQMVIYAAAFIVTLRWSRTWADIVTAAFYVPLFFLCLEWWSGPESYDTWWMIFYIASAQLVMIPFTTDWMQARETWNAFRERRDWYDGMFRVWTCS